MQTTRPPTHRLRFSPPQQAAFELSMTDHQDALHELLSYISMPPEQFYGQGASLVNGRPEAELMRAVLADALGCFQKGLVHQGRRVQRLAREAEEWLFNDDARWPFSFVSICAVLGLEPAYIRQGLRRWGQGRPPTAAKKRSHMGGGTAAAGGVKRGRLMESQQSPAACPSLGHRLTLLPASRGWRFDLSRLGSDNPAYATLPR